MTLKVKRNFNDDKKDFKKSQNLPKKFFSLRNFLLIFVVIVGVFIAYKKANNDEKLKVAAISVLPYSDYASPYRSHFRVFNRMNLQVIETTENWDILWTREYPWNFEYKPLKFLKHKKLLPHHKVNHFPGIYSLTIKINMNKRNNGNSFILPSFFLPNEQKEFDEFINKFPHKKVVEKNFHNRGVKIVDVKNLKPKDEHFYQEFLDNPFLVNGHAIDFGVYVLITSFDPIRAYRYTDEILLRFCPEKFHPFDAENRRKYVVQDDSITAHFMPGFKEIYETFKFPAKLMFEDVIKKQGHDVVKFWKRIDEAIGTVVKNSESAIINEVKRLNKTTQNFFEIVRFDILFDAELNPYVVEVNMSPNLTPSAARYEESALIYEQVIYNVMKMIGSASKHEFMSRFDKTDTIIKNYKNLATSLTECIQNDCQNNCNKTICEICQPCMKPQTFYQLSEAFRENQNAANFKRVFPTKIHFDDEKLMEKMTKNNQIMMKWFKAKCEDDERWC